MFFVYDKFVILHLVMVERQSKIIRTSVVGILANVALAAFKAGVGLLANSIAVVLDAVNNLSDALSSVITIVGMKLASKPADKEHPLWAWAYRIFYSPYHRPHRVGSWCHLAY